MASAYYEIRVAGTLPSEVLLDFERLTADVAPVQTILRGPLPDQAALAVLLARLEEFGADVIEIRRLVDSDPAARSLRSRAPDPSPARGDVLSAHPHELDTG
jgi:hypothetical protein